MSFWQYCWSVVRLVTLTIALPALRRYCAASMTHTRWITTGWALDLVAPTADIASRIRVILLVCHFFSSLAVSGFVPSCHVPHSSQCYFVSLRYP